MVAHVGLTRATTTTPPFLSEGVQVDEGVSSHPVKSLGARWCQETVIRAEEGRALPTCDGEQSAAFLHTHLTIKEVNSSTDSTLCSRILRELRLQHLSLFSYVFFFSCLTSSVMSC